MTRRLTNAETVPVMRAAGLEPLEDYPGSGVPWLCLCTSCGKEVSPRYKGIKGGQSGCLSCALRKDACPAGHPFDETNTIWEKGRRGLKVQRCRTCKSARQREHYVRNTYGLSLTEYDELLLAQDFLCAVCARPLELEGMGALRACIDHDHGTGEVRGILCSSCNIGIGNLGDDPARLRAAAEYLENVLRPALRSVQ